MPKASPEETQAAPRVARAILSAPYPLATTRSRAYLIFHPIAHPGRPLTGRLGLSGQHATSLAFLPHAPFFRRTQSSDATLTGTGLEGPPASMTGFMPWGGPVAIAPPPNAAAPLRPEAQRSAEELARILNPPLSASTVATEPMSGIEEEASAPLNIAREVGMLTMRQTTPVDPVASTSSTRPLAGNLLTSTFQTILPRSLLEFRQMRDEVCSPPKLTSSTTFFTGVTAGHSSASARSSPDLPTVRDPASPECPVTPTAPVRPGLMKRRTVSYGQKGRESDSASEDEDWSSDATVTKHTSPLTPRLITPGTPAVNRLRSPFASSSSRHAHIKSQRLAPRSAPSQVTDRPVHSTPRQRPRPQPLFLGQTNLSPFTYDPARARHRRHSGSTMSLLGYESAGPGESDDTVVTRVPSSFYKRRKKRHGNLFSRAPGPGLGRLREEGERVEEAKLGRQEKGKGRAVDHGSTSPNATRRNGLDPLPHLPQPAQGQPEVNVPLSHTDFAYASTAAPAAPTTLVSHLSDRAWSPQPMSIDPRSANPLLPSWPRHLTPLSNSYGSAPVTDSGPSIMYHPGLAPSHATGRQFSAASSGSGPNPFAKACHNFLRIRHKQAAKKRKLLQEYHRRVKVEEAQREEREGVMQVDTPALPQFPPHHLDAPRGTGLAADEGHGVGIRAIGDIARVEDKRPKKRRRDISPESVYRHLTDEVAKSRSPKLSTTNRHPTLEASPVRHLESAPVQSYAHLSPHHTPGVIAMQPSTALGSFARPQVADNGSSQAAGGALASTSLLPSIELRPPSPRSALHDGITFRPRPGPALAQNTPSPPNAAGLVHSSPTVTLHPGTNSPDRVRIPAGPNGALIDFERSRAEDMDWRLMEDVKLERRDEWLEDVRMRRQGGYGGKRGKWRR